MNDIVQATLTRIENQIVGLTIAEAEDKTKAYKNVLKWDPTYNES